MKPSRLTVSKEAAPGNTEPKPFQPAPGRTFRSAEETKAETEHDMNKTRSLVVYAVIAALCFALIYALVLSTVKGDFTYLTQVWAVTGPVVGAIVAYYFRDR